MQNALCNSFQKPPFTLCSSACACVVRGCYSYLGRGVRARTAVPSGRVYTRRVRLAHESPTCVRMTTACVSLLLRSDSSCDAVPVVGSVLGFVHLSRGRHPETLRCPLVEVSQRTLGPLGEDNGHPSPRLSWGSF